MMEEVSSTMIYCKNFCKCHKVPPSTTIKERIFDRIRFYKLYTKSYSIESIIASIRKLKWHFLSFNKERTLREEEELETKGREVRRKRSIVVMFWGLDCSIQFVCIFKYITDFLHFTCYFFFTDEVNEE
jgi:hypothetical protein